MARTHFHRFFARQPFGVILGAFALAVGLIYFGGCNLELQPQHFQQLLAPRRL
jgi:hypothetical protein